MAHPETQILNHLFDLWHQARADGRELSARELCVGYPQLEDEFARRLDIVRRSAGIAAPHQQPGPGTGSSGETLLEPSYATPVTIRHAAGHEFDGYLLIRLIGRGGMGEVWEALDNRLNRRVAIKLMRPELATSEKARERFLRESRAQAAIRHPHVSVIHTVGEYGVPYFVMPLLKGESLGTRLYRQPLLPIPEVVRIGREMAEGLAAAHQVGLIHRDVKPGNVWLEAGTASVVLLDFGVAQVEGGEHQPEPITCSGEIVGTPDYMSPEQAGGGRVDARSDLFSLGVVLYEMAVGARPFEGKAASPVRHAVVSRDPLPPHEVCPDIPLALSELILGLLAKDPSDRWPELAAEVADRLKLIEAGDDRAITSASRPTVRATPRRRTAGVRRLLAPAFVLILVLVAAWLVTQQPRGIGRGVAGHGLDEYGRVPTLDERVSRVANHFHRKTIQNTRQDVTRNGFLKSTRKNIYHFAGTTGQPLYSLDSDTRATIKIPYNGEYERDSTGIDTLFHPLPETKTVSGVMVVRVTPDEIGLRMEAYEQTELAGQVTDPNHDAQVSARLAVLDLVRTVLPIND